ncbi:MAG: hypothetical protein Q9199_003735, partial [Rusavskia elegans]
MRCHHRFFYLSLVLSPLLVSLVQAVPPSGAGAHARAAASPPVNAGSRTRPQDSQGQNTQKGPNGLTGANRPTGPHDNMQTYTHENEEQQEKKEPAGLIDGPATDNGTPESKSSNTEKPRPKQQGTPGDGDDDDPTPSAEAQASATPAIGRSRNQYSSAAETTATSQNTIAIQTISSATSAAVTPNLAATSLATSTTPDTTPSDSSAVSSARGTVGLLASQVRLVGLLLGSLIF